VVVKKAWKRQVSNSVSWPVLVMGPAFSGPCDLVVLRC
jgi:hypothetical protein